MANYDILKVSIAAVIKENGNQEITGNLLQQTLFAMVNSLGTGYQFAGIASQAVIPGTPDAKLFYIAAGPGTYENFNNLVVNPGEIAVFFQPEGSSAWYKQAVTIDVSNKADKVADATEGDVASLDSSGNLRDSGIPSDNVAQKDGYYETLVAGAAENLIGRGTVPAEFTRRTSGGNADIGSGTAIIEKIRGNSLVWNQQTKPAYFAVSASEMNSTIQDGKITLTLHTAGGLSSASFFVRLIENNAPNFKITGHKYLVSYIVSTTCAGEISLYNGFASFTGDGNIKIPVGQAVRASFIATGATGAPTTTNSLYFYYNRGLTKPAVGDSIILKDIIAIDLTQMFGPGNEPSTVAEFEALFASSFYAYNAGELLSMKGTGIKTIGFNQLKMAGRAEYTGGNLAPTSAIAVDESKYYNGITANGYYNATANHHTNLNIGEGSIGGTCVTANYGVGFPVKAFPNTTYYIKGTARIGFYDSEGWFIDSVTKTDATFTTPANCAWCLVVFGFTAGAYSYSDLNLNLSWSGYRDGEYEKYWESVLDLPITTLTSGGNVIFPDGMKSAGTASDELTRTKAVKVILKHTIQSGDLAISGSGGANERIYVSNIASGKGVDAGVIGNIRCPKYSANTFNAVYAHTYDKIICMNTNGDTAQIYDSALIGKTIAEIRAALVGMEIFYEAATPTDYTLDTPLDLNYRVDDFGLEILLPENGNAPVTSPIIYAVRYAMNAVDTLRNLPKNYIGKDSMEHILTALVTAGVIAGYTLTWNATNENYDCSITPITP